MTLSDFNADHTAIHPARAMPFPALANGLQAAIDKGLVRRTDRDGASLYCYSKDCVYNSAWDDITVLARGLILDHDAGVVIATPFPKFFNVGEGNATIPDTPFDVYEKMDGSLVIIYWHRGRWKAATKGSLNSEQAQWAERELSKANTMHLYPGCTYLCEAIYPENRIVIRYPFEGLVLLSVYAEDGRELAYRNVRAIADSIGWRCAQRIECDRLSELMIKTKTLPVTEEGYVLRFADRRLKLKGAAYCAVHRLISGCTPLALWEAMLTGEDLRVMRKALPEEFWRDFDLITHTLALRLATFLHQIDTAVESVAYDPDVDDRELGKTLKSRFPGPWAQFVFHRRKKGPLLLQVEPGKPIPLARRAAFMYVRPTGNRLEGYTPSASVHRVQEELL